MVEFTLKAFGDKSDEYTDSLYLQSKVKFVLGEKLQAFDIIKIACKIERKKPVTGTSKDLQKAMMYLMKAQCFTQAKGDLREALKCYRSAILYVSGITQNQQNMQMLMKNIISEAELCLKEFQK